MKFLLKSALLKGLPLAVCAGLLAACDQIEWPHVWGPDEVPQAVRDEPRDVPAPPPVPIDTPYPLVGAVPSKPKTFTPQPTIDLTKEMMEDDRDQGFDAKQQLGPTTTSSPQTTSPTTPPQ